jgi:hypothetical protein
MELKAAIADLAVDIALSQSKGNTQRAAGLLGVSDRAIQMRKHSARQDR